MSWVSIHKFSRTYRSIDEIPQGEKLLPLGSRSLVHKRVLNSFPGTDWSDPSRGVWDSANGSVEFNLVEEEPATGLMLYVRANANVTAAIVQLCLVNSWQGIDCRSGQLLEQSNDPAQGGSHPMGLAR